MASTAVLAAGIASSRLTGLHPDAQPPLLAARRSWTSSAVVGVVGLVAAVPRGHGRLAVLLVATYGDRLRRRRLHRRRAVGSAGWSRAPWSCVELAGAARGRRWPERLGSMVSGSLVAIVVFMSVIGIGRIDRRQVVEAAGNHRRPDRGHALAGDDHADPEHDGAGADKRDGGATTRSASGSRPSVSAHSLATVQGSEWLGRRRIRSAARERTSTHPGVRRRRRGLLSRRSIPAALDLRADAARSAARSRPSDCCPALRATLAECGLRDRLRRARRHDRHEARD